MIFKKGDRVTWKSQSQGWSTTKEGTIIAVVPMGHLPQDYGYRANGGPPGNPRNHVSYIVKANEKTYWPLVKYLSLLNEVTPLKEGNT